MCFIKAAVSSTLQNTCKQRILNKDQSDVNACTKMKIFETDYFQIETEFQFSLYFIHLTIDTFLNYLQNSGIFTNNSLWDSETDLPKDLLIERVAIFNPGDIWTTLFFIYTTVEHDITVWCLLNEVVVSERRRNE